MLLALKPTSGFLSIKISRLSETAIVHFIENVHQIITFAKIISSKESSKIKVAYFFKFRR